MSIISPHNRGNVYFNKRQYRFRLEMEKHLRRIESKGRYLIMQALEEAWALQREKTQA